MINWDALGALGELVAALAVLITLIYLAVQVRQAKAALHISSFQEGNRLMNEATLALAKSPELAKAIAIASAEPEKLEEWQWRLIEGYIIAIINSWELILEQVGSGSLEVDRADVVAAFRSALQDAWIQPAWQRVRHQWPRKFREYVDDQVGRGLHDDD